MTVWLFISVEYFMASTINAYWNNDFIDIKSKEDPKFTCSSDRLFVLLPHIIVLNLVSGMCECVCECECDVSVRRGKLPVYF